MLIDPITTENPRYEGLVSALLECSTLINRDKRTELISRIDKSTGNQVGVSDSSRNAAISIVNAYYGFPHNIDVLLDAIKNLEGETYQYNKLKDLIFDIAKSQQEKLREKFQQTNEPFDTKYYDETFESLWSELCSILDTIDWKHIWEACSKIKEINKNDKEVYIKSLCFTKNYEFLKQVFLDRYEPTLLIIKLAQSLKDDNEYIKSWLDKANHKLEKTEAAPDPNIDENRSCLPPILLIMVERLANGEDQGKWNVRGQFKTQDKQEEISLSQDKPGFICKTFEEIPQIIKAYIDFIENDSKFSNEKINKLRIELFLPLSEIKESIDTWTIDSEDSLSIPLITKHRLFLRITERISKRRNTRIQLLQEGWKRIGDFLKSDLEISKASLGEIMKKSKTSNLIEILNVSNWIELIDCIEHCPSLWCMIWKGTLPNDESDRMNFFGSILDSGIPIAFWNWHSIPQEVEFETKFTDCLRRDNLVDRCQQLLETTWSLRRVAWGEKEEIERQKKPGYYLGMLLEDPEILPEENKLQTIGVNT